MEKVIKIDGKDIKFKATANVPRMYRIWFRRDIMKDMIALKDSTKEVVNSEGKKEYSPDDLSIFENVAYTMARLADPENVPHTIDDWFDGFKTFSIYQILPELLELWSLNMETTSTSKKNLNQVTGK